MDVALEGTCMNKAYKHRSEKHVSIYLRSIDA